MSFMSRFLLSYTGGSHIPIIDFLRVTYSLLGYKSAILEAFNMKRFLLIIFLTSFLAAANVASASELFGTVWYKGQPLPNAEITVQDKKIQTNAKGYYSVDLEPGAYKLGIKLPDGKIREEKADVFPQDTEKNLKLE